jgi:hypothetical protein
MTSWHVINFDFDIMITFFFDRHVLNQFQDPAGAYQTTQLMQAMARCIWLI